MVKCNGVNGAFVSVLLNGHQRCQHRRQEGMHTPQAYVYQQE